MPARGRERVIIMTKLLTILKKTLLTLAFPVGMFLVMWLITALCGADNFVSPIIMRQVLTDGSLTAIIALAIYLQFKNGRFDFSGGATMILTAIIAGNVTYNAGGNVFMFLGLCIAVGVILSLITSIIYSFSRVPVIICTIAVTLVYEAITYLIFEAKGLNIISYDISKFGKFPFIFVPLIIAVLFFLFYSNFTVEGKRGKLLSMGQRSAVNIGIAEKKNVIACYFVTGIILGLGALVYGSQNIISPQSNLSTSSILFSYIVPVFIGMFLGKASVDAVGIAVASVGMAIMNSGLDCLGVGGGGVQQIIFGMFMLCFYAFSGQFDRLKSLFMRKTLKNTI